MFKAIGSMFGMSSSSTKKDSDIFTLTLKGQLFKKKVGENPRSLSEVCIMSLICLDEVTFDYIITILNKGGNTSNTNHNLLDQWDSMTFDLNADLNPKLFTDSSNSATLVWEKNREFYFYEVDEEMKEEDIANFLENFCGLIHSNTMEVEISKINKFEAKESLIYYGNVGDINKFIDDNYIKIYQDVPIVSEQFLNEETEINQKLERLKIEEELSSKKQNQTKTLYFRKTYPNATLMYQGKVID